MKEFLIGKLELSDLPNQWFTIAGSAGIIMMLLSLAAFIT